MKKEYTPQFFTGSHVLTGSPMSDNSVWVSEMGLGEKEWEVLNKLTSQLGKPSTKSD